VDVAAVHEVVAVVRDAGVLEHEAADNHHKALDEQRRLKGMPHPAEMDVGKEGKGEGEGAELCEGGDSERNGKAGESEEALGRKGELSY